MLFRALSRLRYPPGIRILSRPLHVLGVAHSSRQWSMQLVIHAHPEDIDVKRLAHA